MKHLPYKLLIFFLFSIPTTGWGQTLNKDSIIQQMIANMVYVEGGTIMMGFTEDQYGPDQSKNQIGKEYYPPHKTSVSSFYIAKYEVTQQEWEAVMGSNPSRVRTKNRPVEYISWDDCQDFIFRLNQLTGKMFRMPTKEEWEFAARGGRKSKGYKYAGSNDYNEVAWVYENSILTTSKGEKKRVPHPVGRKRPNELGLYDMSGNVWEWCQDKWEDSLPQGSQQYHVIRGGSCREENLYARLSNQAGYYCRTGKIGLRLAMSCDKK